jgi:hypothetical protein
MRADEGNHLQQVMQVFVRKVNIFFNPERSMSNTTHGRFERGEVELDRFLMAVSANTAQKEKI